MEGVYENLDKLKGKQLENIRDNRELAFLSRKIATIVTDLDFELDVDEVSWPSFDIETVTEAYKTIRFSAHLDKLLKLVGQEGAAPAAPAFELAEAVEGKEALAIIERALSEGERVSVAFSKPTQESLFAPEITLAVTTSQGVALVESDEALSIFARIAKEGSFAALDAKAALHEVYPVDSSESALLSDADVLGCDAFDAALAAYVLNSSAGKYPLEALAETHLDMAVPEAHDDKEAASIESQIVAALVPVLESRLEADGTANVYRDIDLPLVGVLAMMERKPKSTSSVSASSSLPASSLTSIRPSSSGISCSKCSSFRMGRRRRAATRPMRRFSRSCPRSTSCPPP